MRVSGGRSRPMPNIVVLVKQVPDTYSERKLTEGDFTLDRDSADAVPAILAELLGYPQLTHARKVELDGGTIRVDRETEEGITHLEAALPAVVSVGEKINEPRYPSFKGIMAAKKKPVDTLTVADLGLDAGEVGLGNAWSAVLEAAPKPPRAAGQRINDEGDGGSKVAEYLVAQKLI